MGVTFTYDVTFRSIASTGSDAPRAAELNEATGHAGGEVRWHREFPLARTSGINRMEAWDGTNTGQPTGQAGGPTGAAGRLVAPPTTACTGRLCPASRPEWHRT